ncbi:MAG TPA: PilZ domain-containing protein [Candidatus Goldiibacteriota bacterium]|nr:PilZ domain-containing protein [Candidatus Goldiibacteriota bacterium]
MPEGQMYVDRRKHKRVEKILKVSYRVMPKEESEKELASASRRHVSSADISTSGMQLLCEEELKPDNILRIDVSLDEGGQLATFAEIRWVRNDEKLKKYRVGLEFIVIKEDHITAIRKITGE